MYHGTNIELSLYNTRRPIYGTNFEFSVYNTGRLYRTHVKFSLYNTVYTELTSNSVFIIQYIRN